MRRGLRNATQVTAALRKTWNVHTAPLSPHRTQFACVTTSQSSHQWNIAVMVDHRMFPLPVEALPKRVPTSCRNEGRAPAYAPQQVD